MPFNSGGGGIISLVGAGGKTSLMFRLARELSEKGDPVLTTTTTRICAPGESQSDKVIVGGSLDEIRKQAVAHLKRHRHLTAAAGLLEDQGKLIGLAPETVDALGESGLFRWIIAEADGAGRPAPEGPGGPRTGGSVRHGLADRRRGTFRPRQAPHGALGPSAGDLLRDLRPHPRSGNHRLRRGIPHQAPARNHEERPRTLPAAGFPEPGRCPRRPCHRKGHRRPCPRRWGCRNSPGDHRSGFCRASRGGNF